MEGQPSGTEAASAGVHAHAHSRCAAASLSPRVQVLEAALPKELLRVLPLDSKRRETESPPNCNALHVSQPCDEVFAYPANSTGISVQVSYGEDSFPPHAGFGLSFQ